MNEFCRRFGVKIPIIQAPMGSVAGPQLCRAVAEAGAMGSMGLTWTPEEKAVEQVKSLSGLSFMVNFVLHFEPSSLWAVADAGAPLVGFSWGDPAPYVSGLRERGIKIAIQAGSVDGIRRFAELEPDLLILQGIEAGGHVQSTTSLAEMLEEAVEAARKIPLAAAGGIADGGDIARTLGSGAQAAVLGTRFLLADEADAHPQYRSALESARAGDTVMTGCFEGGWPGSAHRVLRNSTLIRWESAGCPLPGNRPGEGDPVAAGPDGSPILRYGVSAPRGATVGDIEAMCLYAGTGVGRLGARGPAGQLVQELWQEASKNM